MESPGAGEASVKESTIPISKDGGETGGDARAGGPRKIVPRAPETRIVQWNSEERKGEEPLIESEGARNEKQRKEEAELEDNAQLALMTLQEGVKKLQAAEAAAKRAKTK